MQQLVSVLTAAGGPDWDAALSHVLELTGARAGRLTVQGREVASQGNLTALLGLPLVIGARRGGLLELSADASPDRAADCAGVLALAAEAQGLSWSFEQFRKGAAHDIRGAMARASNLVQMLAKRIPPDEESTRLASFAVQQLTDGEQLLRDVVAYTQAATQAIDVQPLPLQGVIETLVYNNRRRVEAAGGRLVVPSPVEVCVRANETVLLDVLDRLISNTLAYAGDQPLIVLSIESEPDVRLTVTDSGPVFEQSYSERIFEPFYRLHGKKFPGNGLGLSTARKLVEGMGGQMKARAAQPAGLAVELSLPLS
jgi:signal transduction histidine kinase